MDPLGEALSPAGSVAAPAELTVGVASEADAPYVSQILVEAARWLIGRGQPLWRPEDLAPASLEPELELGRIHVARLAGEPVATIALAFEDPLFWPDAVPGEGGYVHRLAVRRRVAGQGVSHALLSWAAACARRHTASFLRLDCSAAHPGLCRFYERAGFSRHSAGRLGDYSFVRYQRSVEAG